MYPEGTRNKTCDKLQPFKKGAFNLAIACQAPIIPVVTSPYYFLDGEKRIFNNGNFLISVGLFINYLIIIKYKIWPNNKINKQIIRH